ncbi:MAG: hypothetical protein KDB08_02545 [Microthrixaceae bacterium]|nr:hypothetical protein [Microthrixaceae bacterium]
MLKTLLISLSTLVVGAVLAAGAIFLFNPPILNWVGVVPDKNTQVVTAVTGIEEVALVSLSIEGLQERRTEAGQVLFLTIPNSRAAFLRYSFDAKIGIKADEVAIEELADGSFLITIPPFIVIGLDNQNYAIAAENNDLLSWTTPEIDKVAMINELFNPEVEAAYLTKSDELLKSQTRHFYKGIVTAIDPDATVTFEFAQ